jgi:hypothetical protein
LDFDLKKDHVALDSEIGRQRHGGEIKRMSHERQIDLRGAFPCGASIPELKMQHAREI